MIVFSSYFTDLRIQTSTHDSIEDARTALALYKKYKELSSTGDTEDPLATTKSTTQQKDNNNKMRVVLKEMYEQGRALGWKVPPEKGKEGEGRGEDGGVGGGSEGGEEGEGVKKSGEKKGGVEGVKEEEETVESELQEIM